MAVSPLVVADDSITARTRPRPFLPAGCAMGLVVAVLAATAHGNQASRVDAPDAWQEDANLSDVFFVDDQYGWAVGDLGTIWHTSNGGSEWHLQQTPVHHRLKGVCFVDRDHGWAVGGQSHPFTHRSSGIVLSTNNGGKTWESIPGLLLPSLEYVRFDTKQTGWAAGNTSALYPTGVFRTQDGGRTWTSFPGGAGRHYGAATLRGNAGILVHRSGQIDTLRDSRVQNTATLPFRVFNASEFSALLAPNVGFVGDGGRPWLTVDGGGTWQRVGALPPDCERQFRFATMATVGNYCWLVGTPGSRVWRSIDNARTWNGFPTGETLPMNALRFTDPQRGWAVGALGTIIATRDGGQTWERQRGGGRRMAAMGVYARPADVPYELFASLSAAEDYRAHVALLTMGTQVPSDLSAVPMAQRLKDAMAPLGVGSDVLSRLSLPEEKVQLSPGQLAAHWDDEAGGSSLQQLTEQLVRSIRVWRPEVVFTSRDDASRDGASQLVNQLVLDAIDLAADPQAYPHQQKLGGLSPWNVTQVFVESTRAEENSAGAYAVNSRQLALATVQVVANLAFDARSLLSSETLPPVETRWFRALKASRQERPESERRPKGTGLLHHLAISYNSAARRKRTAPSNLGQLRQVAVQQRNIEAMLARGDRLTTNGTHLLEQASQLAESLDSHAAGDVLYQLAARFARQGDLELAADAHRRLVNDHVEHPFAEPSLVWLIHYQSSAEIDWREERQKPPTVQFAGGEASGVASTNRPSGGSPLFSGGIRGQVASPSVQVKSAGEHSRRTVTLASQLRSSHPALLAEPFLQFPLAAAHRSIGKERDAESIYRQQLATEIESPWRERAASELSWAKSGTPRTTEEQTVWRCRTTDQPPHLDGILDEEFWQSASPVKLSPSSRVVERNLSGSTSKQNELRSTSPPIANSRLREEEGASDSATAWMARDAEYLYLAIHCAKLEAVSYAAAERPRSRDGDLFAHDRIDLMLDTNRDYASFWHLTVDHRGWTNESVLGDASWDPQWYVASSADDTSWTIEAAIPLNELCPQPPEPGEAWAVGLQRIIPSHGMQTWGRPGGATPRPCEFQMLAFE